MSTQNKIPNTDTTSNISISFLNDGTLNYNFSPDLSLAEVIGSFVVIAHGLLSNNSNTSLMLKELISSLTVAEPTHTEPSIKETTLFNAMDGLLADFKAKQ